MWMGRRVSARLGVAAACVGSGVSRARELKFSGNRTRDLEKDRGYSVDQATQLSLPKKKVVTFFDLPLRGVT